MIESMQIDPNSLKQKDLNTILFSVIGGLITILLAIIAYNMIQVMELNYENSKAVILINNKADYNKEMLAETKACADKIEGKVDRNTEKITHVEKRTDKIEFDVVQLKELTKIKEK